MADGDAFIHSRVRYDVATDAPTTRSTCFDMDKSACTLSVYSSISGYLYWDTAQNSTEHDYSCLDPYLHLDKAEV